MVGEGRIPEFGAYTVVWIAARVMMYVVACQYLVSVFILTLEVLGNTETVNEDGLATAAMSLNDV